MAEASSHLDAKRNSYEWENNRDWSAPGTMNTITICFGSPGLFLNMYQMDSIDIDWKNRFSSKYPN